MEHISEINECTWDKKTKTLTTSSEASQKKELDCFDSPFWNQAFDIEEMLALDKKDNNKIYPETLFNLELESAGTIKSIHNRTKAKGISFAVDVDDKDEDSADSSIDSNIQLDADNRNTEAMGKLPVHCKGLRSCRISKGEC